MSKMQTLYYSTLILLFLLASCNPSISTPTGVPTKTPQPAPTREVPVLMDAEKLARFEDYAVEAMQMAEIPGMSVAIVENGRVIYAKGFGVRELGKEEPVTPDTRMLIGSVSKPLTSLMMASVVDDGLMQWDTPVTSILPTFAVADAELTQKLTMQDLICACSGVISKETYTVLSRVDQAEEMISHMPYNESVATFGKKFIYNNTMFASGGYIAGLAAGGPKDDLDAGYSKAMQERVFDPVAMTHTTLSLDVVQSSGEFAMPHGKTLESHYLSMPLASEYSVLGMKPAGGIWSTAEDMSRLLLTLLDLGMAPNGQRIVSQDNLKRIWQPGVKLGPEDDSGSYGHGWFINEFQGRRMISHPGNTVGFSAEFALLPESRLGIVILTNAEGAGSFTEAIIHRFLELAFEQPFSQDAEFRSNLQASRQAYLNFAKQLRSGFDEQTMTPFLGTYFNPEIGTIAIQAVDDKLMLHSEGLTAELSQFIGPEDGVFFISDIPRVTIPALRFKFRTDSNGKPILTVYEEDVLEPYIFERMDTP